MDLAYFARTDFAVYAYFDTMPRGFGFNAQSGYSVLRLGRLVIEWGR